MFDWSQYTGNLTWLPQRTIFLTRHGSHAYGTNIETSDEDFRGVAIPPVEYLLGTQRFDQAVCNGPDLTVFELRKFLGLASQCNPNVLEVLFTEPEDHVQVSPLGARLLDNRDMFVTKRCRHTFSGYAASQLKRIKRHYQWLKNPPKAPPERKAFGLPERTVIPKDQLGAAAAAINSKLDSWSLKFLDHLDDATRIAVQNGMAEHLAEMGIASDHDRWQAAARSVGFSDNFLELLDAEKRYESAKKEWDSYQRWKRERNPQRAELEAKFGYDCYADDTQFLTAAGWKLFDEITNEDLLATVFIRQGIPKDADMSHRVFTGVEYQGFTNKFDSVYNGPMYRVSGHHTDSLVTANHRMLVRKVRRKDGIEGEWALEEAAALADTFDVLVAPRPKRTTFSNKHVFDGLPVSPNAYLSLMGWYLSDGCAVFDANENGRVKGLRISQSPGGKLSWHMTRWHGKHGAAANSSLYRYQREPNEYNPRPHDEQILEVRHPSVGGRIVSECGSRNAKRIPRYVFRLSKKLMERLLIGMLRGDGAQRAHRTRSGSHTYYSKSLELANDIQELALLSGWETALWGPYTNTDLEGRECHMYHVHMRRSGVTRRLVRSANVERVEVSNQRVVCFTVPNGTLITRRNGKVSIHGNCKHAMHLVRLLRMCREILTTGKVIVRRPDAAELLAIRAGAWEYHELVEWAERQDAEMQVLYQESSLPKSIDQKRLDGLCVGLARDSLVESGERRL